VDTDSLTQFLSRRRPQLWGAIFGALGGAAFAGAITSLLPGAAFLWLGAPVATFLGWRLGPAAVQRQPCVALRMALGCTAIGALLTGILLAASTDASVVDQTSQVANVLLQGVALGALGLLIFGLPSTFILWAAATIWVVLVRNVAAGAAVQAPGMQETPA
jgi:hypothetical protein